MTTALIVVSVLMVLGWYRAMIWKHRYEFVRNSQRLHDLGDMSTVTWGRKE